MANFIGRIFGGNKKKKVVRRDSITGRNSTWPVPYLMSLDGMQLSPGQSLIVRGVVIGNGRFDVNLSAGCQVEGDSVDDIVLHISSRINDKKIVVNSMSKGQWGKEHRSKCPFLTEEEFDYRVRAHDSHFEVFVNHKLATKFHHRLPLNSITHVFVNGDVELYNVSWEGKYYSIPYAADVPGNFYPGRKLFVSGMPAKKSQTFTIDLHAGSDIALHFNPRFDEKKVVRNTKTDGNWGVEERDGEFPMAKKQSFDVIVYCEENQFKCYVDGELFCTYKNRVAPKEIDKLSINGDIELHGVHLK